MLKLIKMMVNLKAMKVMKKQLGIQTFQPISLQHVGMIILLINP